MAVRERFMGEGRTDDVESYRDKQDDRNDEQLQVGK